VTEQRAEDLTKSGGSDGAPQPPAANQHKDEPIAVAPEESAQSSDQPVEAAPGDSHGVPVPSTHAAAGTSEDGVALPAVTPPGKPDGEVDTRG
jgi:hypothetical protein